MSKLKAFLGYAAAVLAIPVVLATFIGMNTFAELLVNGSGITISPWITGGEVVRSVEHGAYQTRIYRAIFDGLFWQNSTGFVQIVWTPSASLPAVIQEKIDYDNDGAADFEITLHPAEKSATYTPLSANVTGLEPPFRLGDGVGIRINLQQKKQ
jgi:hypothetical protein